MKFELCYGVSLGHLYLPIESHQLLLLFPLTGCFGLLLLFSLIGLLHQLLVQIRHLLVESMEGLLILILFVGQSFIALPKMANHPLFSDAPILECLHVHQRLKINYNHQLMNKQQNKRVRKKNIL